MLARLDQPIVAIATAAGRGAVGIVRVSGRGLDSLMRAVVGRVGAPRTAHYGPFLAADGSAIDHGLALRFPAPHSYTGEDVLELQAHGGPVVLQLLLARCLEAAAEPDPDAPGRLRLAGLRLAQPGEFTERAYLNDKLDLAQAEAVADLIDASTEAAARGAARSLSGALSQPVSQLREALIELRALVEATLDFPEEEIDFLQKADAIGRLDRLAARLDGLLATARQGALLREGLQVVIAGQPNAGKSSLLNALAGAELAIVTPIPGTTRDKVSETLQIEGVPVHVTDTAGLREDTQASDEVERIGIARSWQAIAQADAVLLLHDLTRLDQPDYRQAEAQIAGRLPAGARLLHVFNKADAIGLPAEALDERIDAIVAATGNATDAETGAAMHAITDDLAPIRLSAKTGAGLDALRRALLHMAGWQAVPEGVFIARERHLHAMRAAATHLAAARDWASQGDHALDLLAEELRLSHDALGEVIGAYSSDELLGDIFGRFCIGK
ncbi:tRNA uridine-5-carboxymethylaminomethyl(34) synthesis GTPase MnmE [Leptothrix discophora]|uniref:tRNA modification GTPase MnmE n=1 Tax=Leptothrix discophora TaxID=89 RepID=A0ABT9G3Q8_LEPDI|nr:tRNA uridine-5-carboxymethylaminomethyl(34) synthesis GTPase MnmE [Leptothrix discophora]MDP4301124.1 tRNA uridine-5-carboxymethylaminomethyl(34) synthesis GTPase MnmE [Leptothrix discophora]